MTDQAAALQVLLDKQEITELLTRYLRSVDRGDVATLRACYLPGATEDHGGLFAGPAQDYVDSVAMTAAVLPRGHAPPVLGVSRNHPSTRLEAGVPTFMIIVSRPN